MICHCDIASFSFPPRKPCHGRCKIREHFCIWVTRFTHLLVVVNRGGPWKSGFFLSWLGESGGPERLLRVPGGSWGLGGLGRGSDGLIDAIQRVLSPFQRFFKAIWGSFVDFSLFHWFTVISIDSYLFYLLLHTITKQRGFAASTQSIWSSFIAYLKIGGSSCYLWIGLLSSLSFNSIIDFLFIKFFNFIFLVLNFEIESYKFFSINIFGFVNFWFVIKV
jgi:hypothetical protein